MFDIKSKLSQLSHFYQPVKLPHTSSRLLRHASFVYKFLTMKLKLKRSYKNPSLSRNRRVRSPPGIVTGLVEKNKIISFFE